MLKFKNIHSKVTNLTRYFSCSPVNFSEKKINENLNEINKEHNLPSSLTSKYKVFRDEDAPIIFDVNEEKKRIALDELKIEEEGIDPYEGINMTRNLFHNTFFLLLNF